MLSTSHQCHLFVNITPSTHIFALTLLTPTVKPRVSDEHGVYTFVDLEFVDGESGTYQLVFSVDGIASEPSDPFRVYNALFPDLDSLLSMDHVVMMVIVMVMSIGDR